jgi:arylsulfatase
MPVLICLVCLLAVVGHISSVAATSDGLSALDHLSTGKQFDISAAEDGRTPLNTYKAAARPNIIVILSDDMGYSDLGCYGSEIHTPNLDRLAAHGLRFTQFYNTARCCPTRASLLTGLYPHQAGVGHMTEYHELEGYQGELNQHCLTIAEALKPAGYRTYAVGKWHVARNLKNDGPKHDWPLQRGFDRYYGTIQGAGSYWDPSALVRDNKVITAPTDPDYKPKVFYYTDAISDQASRFVTEHARDHKAEPFFMYVAYTAAHWPLHAKEKDIAKYRHRYDGGYEPVRKARFEREKKLGLIPANTELSLQAGDWASVSNKQWEARCMEVYAAQIDSMDQGIGELVSVLKKTGQLENTVLFFLQDNGGCAESIGRSGSTTRAAKPTLSPLAPDFPMEGAQPKQTRDGWPVLGGSEIMPGPRDSFISYGKAWANVSNTPFREYKHWVHEGGISTPLIVHWPSHIRAHGELRTQPGHLVDIMATCLALAGATYPSEHNGQRLTPLEGKSLLPAFDNQPVAREALFWEHEGNRAVRVANWKLVAKGPAGKWELYNIEKDRAELHDLAAQEPARVQAMTAQWEAYARRANVLPWIWKPQYGQPDSPDDAPKMSPARRFELMAGDDLEGGNRPNIVSRGFTVNVRLDGPAESGVLVAQGGTVNGFALYCKDGTLHWAIRRERELHEITAPLAALGSAQKITASLARDGSLRLAAGGRDLAAGKAPGLLPKLPVDGLQVGRDLKGAVGDYTSPFPFQGKIEAVVLELEP